VQSLDIESDKININNHNVNYFVELLKKEVLNGFVQKIQKIDFTSHFVRIKIKSNSKNFDLIIGNGLLFFTKYKLTAKPENKGFTKLASSVLHNSKINKIEQIGIEKIVQLEFNDFYLIFELFSKNNIVLTDKEYKIKGSLFREKWKDRTIQIGQEYKFPTPKGEDPREYEIIKDGKIEDEKKQNIVSNIMQKINVPPSILERIIKEEKIDKENFKDKDFKKTIDKLKEIYNSKIDFDKTYIINEKTTDLINSEYFKDKVESIDQSLNDILDENIAKKIICVTSEENNYKRQSNIKKHENILKKQENKIKEFENKIEDVKHKGNLIFENIDKIDEIKATIESAIEKKYNLDEIEKRLILKSKEIDYLKIFKKLDKKEKKITFNL
jgi:predicted ribosome quality control (RQC) complex YloA/Tae2 family protein